MTTSAGPSVLTLVGPTARGPIEEAAATAGFRATHAHTVSEFLSELSAARHDGVLISLEGEAPESAVIQRVATHGHCGSLLLSVRAVTLDHAFFMEQVGAVALLREPLDSQELAQHLQSVVAEDAVQELPESSAVDSGFPTMIGSGEAMAPVFEILARVSNSSSTVLVTGESGTGKEVVARVLHAASDRRDGPFVAVNCAAIPEHLLESELFGHERGAFTGAVAQRTGRFELAEGGTLFLDEIGDMSMVLQAKVLRVLEERTLDPVGSRRPVEVDVRVVAATNQALPRQIESGAFREDLYYRLAVVEIELPPLRERGDDVRDLALHFVAEYAKKHSRDVRAISEAALNRLQAYEWPGNVRELRNVIDRAVLLTTDHVLRSKSLRLGAAAPRASARGGQVGAPGFPPSMSMAEVEAAHIGNVLTANDGHMGQAAKSLGVHRNTLTRKVREYGLDAARSSTHE